MKFPSTFHVFSVMATNEVPADASELEGDVYDGGIFSVLPDRFMQLPPSRNRPSYRDFQSTNKRKVRSTAILLVQKSPVHCGYYNYVIYTRATRLNNFYSKLDKMNIL